MVLVERIHQAEISADCAHRVIKGFHLHVAPHQRFRRQALLYARGECQIFLNFSVAFFELFVRVAQFVFGVLQVGNIGKRDNRVLPAIGILDHFRADNHRQPPAVTSRQDEFKSIAALSPASFFLLFDEFGFFFCIELVRVHSEELAARYSGHLLKVGIGKYHVLAIVGDEYTFVQAFKNALNLL